MSEDMTSIALECKGFFRSAVRNSVPDQSTIYFVYGGVKTDSGCSIRRLLYIGNPARVLESEAALSAALSSDEILYYAVAFVPDSIVRVAEWALAQHFSDRYAANLPHAEVAPSDGPVSVSLVGDGVPRIFTEHDRSFYVA